MLPTRRQPARGGTSQASEPGSSTSAARADATSSDRKRKLDDAVSNDDLGNESDFEEPVTKTFKRTRGSAAHDPGVLDPEDEERGVDRTLPPINNVEDAFLDLVRKVNTDLLEIAKTGGFKVRVATMCSGTDAPIFALDLIKKQFATLYPDNPLLEIEHAFSVEYIAWKASFIRRNTNTTVFSDVRDFGRGEGKALTAVGSLEEIPTDIDVLVAGTPCVDFSTLNKGRMQDFTTNVGQDLRKLFNAHYRANIKTDGDKRHMETLIAGVTGWLDADCLDQLKEQGTSSGAFFAMLLWVRKRRPRYVLLENVSGAPWPQMTDVWFPSIGYKAIFIRVDSKSFYIPQTRTRGYLLAVNCTFFPEETATRILDSWVVAFKQSERRASSPIDQWLLPSTDPLAELARQEEESKILDKKRRDQMSWLQSQRRHTRTRREKGLGDTRPLTNWTENGDSRPHDRMDKIFINGQTSRVLDCLDILYLDGIMNGRKPSNTPVSWPYDIMFKTRVIDLSQNVDRISSPPFGLIGCVTPDSIPYITDQSRFLTGYEALLLQGIPIQRVLFSREDQEQLRDLAGNAMTVTVVGTALVALLTSDYKINRGNNPPTLPVISGRTGKSRTPDSSEEIFEISKEKENFTKLTVARTAWSTISELVRSARRYCYCNGVAKYSATEYLKCNHCGIIRCVRCFGNPTHDFSKMDKPPSSLLPGLVALEVMSRFPSTVQVHHVLEPMTMPQVETGPVLYGILGIILDELNTTIFYYRQVHVTEVITICYAAPDHFEIRVTLSEEGGVIWNLYLIPSSSLGKKVMAGPLQMRASDPTVLDHPIARACTTDSRIDSMCRPPRIGDWRFFTFCQESITLIAEKELAMAEEVGVPRKTFLTLAIAANEDLANLSGHAQDILKLALTKYEHIPTCDTAERSLFLSEKLFLFKDPSRAYDPERDSYIIARDCRLLERHEHRDALLKFHPRHQILKLAPGIGHEVTATIGGWWWESTRLGVESPRYCDSQEKWLFPVRSSDAVVKVANHRPYVFSGFQFRLPMAGNWTAQLASIKQALGREWHTVSTADFRCLFNILASYNVKVAGELRKTCFEIVHNACGECSIKKPSVWWLTQNKQVMPYESPEEMKQFDSRLAQRQLPFEVQIAKIGQTIGVRYLFFPAVLAHQASAHLPDIGAALSIDSKGTAIHSAELQTQVAADLRFEFEPFTKSLRPFDDMESASKTNSQSNEALQFYVAPQGTKLGLLTMPPGFKGTLTESQAQSLRHWLDREYNPKPFVEKEAEEYVQPHLNIRLVGRAERAITCRGGIVGDNVGYGKTVVSLALMQMQEKFDMSTSVVERRRKTPARLHSKATLVIVPPHLVTQWRDEAFKFRGLQEPDVLVIKTFEALRKLTPADIMAAKMIIASTSIFASENYRAQLGKYSRKGSCPESKDSRTGGRRVQEWYGEVLAELDRQLEEYLAISELPIEERAARYEALVQKIQSEKTKYETMKKAIQSQLDEATRLRSQWKANKKRGETEATESHAEEVASGNKAGKGKALEPTLPHIATLFFADILLLECYTFARVIIDEFSYEKDTWATLVFSMAQAFSRWVLSATPPTRNLRDVCSTASLLGVHVARPLEQRVGLPLITVGPPLYTQTYAEKVLSYGQLQSDKSVRERHQQGEAFLQHFASANGVNVQQLGISDLTEHVVVNAMTIAETQNYYWAQHVLQCVDLDADLLATANRANLPKIYDRRNLNGHTASGYHLALAASCWPAVETVSGNGGILEMNETLLERAKEELKKYFDKAIWLCRRIDDYEPPKSQAHEIVKDFYCLLEDLIKGDDFSRIYGYDAYKVIFESIFRSDSLEDLEIEVGQGVRDARGAELAKLVDQVRVGSWPSYYNITMADIDKMDDIEVTALAEDAARADKTAMETPRSMLEKYAVAHPSDDAIVNDGNDDYDSYKKDRLVSTCESRGIKAAPSHNKAKLVNFLRQDDAGTLTQDDYVEGKFLPLRKRSFPSLHETVKKRNTNFSHTHDDLLSTTNSFDAATTHVIQMSRQKLVGEIMQTGKFSPCRVCRSEHGLHLVYECGHCLCEEHLQGATRCGDSGDRVDDNSDIGASKCPCLLKHRTIHQSKLEAQSRRLNHDLIDPSWMPSASVEAGNKGLSSKLAMMINCILATPEDEGVLIFVQYPELHTEIQNALDQSGIRYTTHPERVADQISTGDYKVCLLFIDKSESSGSNLQQFANNVMFASPLITDLQEDYEKLMTQAKGRVIRYGQTKPVRILHFVTERTVEVDILELRNKRSVTVEPGEAVGIFEEKVETRDAEGDINMEGTDPVNQNGLGKGTTWSADDNKGSIRSLLGHHAVWQLMNEQNWLTTIGLDR